MTNLIRWNPVRDMMNLRNEFDRFFNDAFGTPTLWERPNNWGLALDVSENEENYIVKADIPNVEPDDLDISLNDNTLTIRGETKSEETKNGEQYHLQERHYGHFGRSITLPATVDPKAVEANYEQGTLRMVIPKAEESKTRRIPVQVGSNGKQTIKGK
jgi:HSP20 family protein